MTKVIERLNQLIAQNYEGSKEEEIEKLIFEYLPSGSGIDAGIALNYGTSTHDKKIELNFSYHFMDEWGSYCGWEDYTLRAYPTFSYPGFRLTIAGKDKNQIKEYFFDLFYDSLMQTCKP